MSKKVLVLCTGNSCRSIIAEALINAELPNIVAHSAGVKASGRVNPHAIQLLQNEGIWENSYHSKTLESVLENTYDLIITVCDHAKETCPMFPKPTPTIHVGFEDPDGKAFTAFEQTLQEIRHTLLPQITQTLTNQKAHTMHRNVQKIDNGINITFTGTVQKQKIINMVENCNTGNCDCMSNATKTKITNMQVSGSDGEVNLALSGDLTTQEIEEALAKSKVINPT